MFIHSFIFARGRTVTECSQTQNHVSFMASRGGRASPEKHRHEERFVLLVVTLLKRTDSGFNANVKSDFMFCSTF